MKSFVQLSKKIKKSKNTMCTAVIPAAGASSRMGGIDKLFLLYKGMPVIAHTLFAFEKSPFIDEIIIPTKSESIDKIKQLCDQHQFKKVTKIICGGETRVHSVYNGVLEADKSSGYIAIHDGARPFISQKLIGALVSAAKMYNAVCPYTELFDTIKLRKGDIIQKTLNRSELVAVQTPQVFQKDLITVALKNAMDHNLEITDDASAVENLGFRVLLVPGERENIKITTRGDLTCE